MTDPSVWQGLDPREFIQRIPKTETHLHIEGALPWHLLQQLDAVKYARTPACWQPGFRFDSFQHFESMLIEWACAWYTTPQRYHQAATAIFAGIQRCNGRYVEVSFHAGLAEFIPALQPAEVVAAIKSAVPKGMEVRVFAGMARNNMKPAMADLLLSLPEIPLLDGVDVHGVEEMPLQSWMAELWQAARVRGKETKAHAGEYGDAGYVREALDFLGVKRIQHGIAAAADEALVQRLVDEKVVLDVCPISNVKLGRVASIAEHPLRQLLQAGVCCTVSTDDPMMFGNNLNMEYQELAEKGGYTPSELLQIARNGWLAGQPTEELRQQALAEIDQLATGVE